MNNSSPNCKEAQIDTIYQEATAVAMEAFYKFHQAGHLMQQLLLDSGIIQEHERLFFNREERRRVFMRPEFGELEI